MKDYACDDTPLSPSLPVQTPGREKMMPETPWRIFCVAKTGKKSRFRARYVPRTHARR
jgi:hypothetical protein